MTRSGACGACAGPRAGATATSSAIAVTSPEIEQRRPAWAPRAPGLALSAAGIVVVALNLRIAVAGVPPVLGEVGLGAAGRSLLVTLPVLAFSAGALAGPWLRGRLGEERAVLALLAALVAGLVVRAAPGAPGLFAGTVLAALAVAVLNVLLPRLVRRRFARSVGGVMAACTAVMTVGAGAAAGLTVPLMDAVGGDARLALAAWALPAALALSLWAPQVRAARVRPAAPGASRPRPVTSAPAARTTSLWRQPLAWQVLLFMGLQSISFYGPLSWLPAIYRDHGHSAAQAGALLMVMVVVMVVSNVAAPLAAARMRDQRPAVAAAVGVTALGVLGVLCAPTAAPVAWAALLGLGQGGTFSLALVLMILRSPDDDTAARLSSMAQCGGYLIAASGPLAMGLLHAATGAWTLPLLLLLAVVAAEMALGLAAGRDRQLPR